MMFKNYKNDNHDDRQDDVGPADSPAANQDNSPRHTRPVPSSQQNQILSALDSLGAKLVRSETERETMRKLLGEAMDAQERLENQLERSQMDLQRRLSNLDNLDKLSEETKARFDEQDKAIAGNKSEVEEQKQRQFKLEDKLRDSQQNVAKLQRRLDTQEQKRARLQRRIERVEAIALEARNALEAKAVVLLTDRAHAATAQLPYIDATAPIQAIENLHKDSDETVKHISSRPARRSWLGGAAVVALVVAALGLGWFGGQSFSRTDKAFAVLQDGTLAQIDIQNGTAQPIHFHTALKQIAPLLPESQPTETRAQDIDSEIIGLETDWIVEDFLDRAEQELADAAFTGTDNSANETAFTEPQVVMPVYDIERDASLPMAVQMIEDKAFEGVPEAQHDLAALYTSGQANVIQDYERAAYWFRHAAVQGIANAAYNLGVLYHQGLGVAQDTPKAMDWYARAAQLGHPEAQYNLGIAYIEGIGTPYNPNMAAAFFQQAALGGIVEAAYNLGLILENGLLGEVRTTDALRWYRGAAEKGSIEAETALHNLSDRLDVSRATAGLLDNGGNLSVYMAHPDDLEPAAGSDDVYIAERYPPQDVDLGRLVPDRQQIVVAQIQGQLAKIRYYEGPQDGILGQDTIAAIKSYQILSGLPITGEPSEDLLSHMLSQGTL